MFTQDRPDRAKEHLVDVVGHFGARLHRIGKVTVEDAAFGCRHMHRAKEPFVVGDLGHERAFEGIDRRSIGGVVDTVDRAEAGLRRGAAVIHIDIRALDLDLGVQVHDFNIAVNVKPKFKFTIGQRFNPAPHQRFRAIMDFVRERHQIGQRIVAEEFAQPPRPQLMGADNCPQIAQHHVRHATVVADDLKEQGILHPRFIELGRRHPNAFGKDIIGLDIAAMAADIRQMGDGAHKGDRLATDKDRGQYHIIGQVAGANPRVVGTEHIAFL